MSKSTNWVYTPKQITRTRGIFYGMNDLMGGGWGNIVSGVIFVFLMTQGINPAKAGFITGIGRLADAIFSLFFGTITDEFYRTKLGRRFGRRHFFILLGGLIFTIVFPMFWIQTDNWVYYLIIYVIIELAVSTILISWESLPTEMTNDYNLRTILSGSRMVISATGTSIVFLILAVLQRMDNPNAYLVTGIIWTFIFVIAIFVSYRTTWERPLTPEFITELENKPKLTIVEFSKKTVKDYCSTFRNKAFREHLAIYALSFTGKDFYSTMLPTFIMVCIYGTQENTAWTLQALSIFGILATIVATKLMIKRGPKFLFMLSFSTILITMVGYISIWALEIKNPIWMLIIISIFYQCARAILEFTPWNVFPFIPDVDRIMTKGDRTGTYAAVMTFFRKSTAAISAWVAGILLSMIGFNADTMSSVINTPNNIKLGVAMIFFFGPVILIGLALVLSIKFKVNRHTHTILKNEIERLEKGGLKSEVTPETKTVVEELTGHNYSTLWPDKPLI